MKGFFYCIILFIISVAFLKKYSSILILLIGSLIFLCTFYSTIILQPNSFIFSNNGDGIVHYFTYCFYIDYNPDYLNFIGMNYPYGENIMYSVGHQWLAVAIKFISNYFPLIKDYKIGILNFILIFQIFLSIIILYKLLKKFEIDPNFSAIIAIGITMLSPQIFRITGHLSLAYTMFFPLTWYLVIRLYQTQFKAKYVIILLLANLLWFFTHPYLAIMSISFYLLFLIFTHLKPQTSNLKLQTSNFKSITSFIISSIIPIIIFRLFITITDTHVGRTDNPSGFFLYYAELDDIFIPNHPPLKTILDKFVTINQHWEAWSYLGLTAIIAILTIIIINIINLIKRRRLNLYLPNPILKAALLSSLILLLFALVIPFRQIPALLDIFPIIKQFRATGRFTWAFFFVANVIAFYYVYTIFKKFVEQKQNLVAYVIIAISTLLLFIESVPYHIETSKALISTPNLFNKNLQANKFIKAIEHIVPTKYQAIIPMPFYFYGSESYARPVQKRALLSSIIISEHCNIPIMTSNLARVSVPESKKIVQLVSPSFYDKEIRNALKSHKPFLLVSSNEPKTSYEQAIIDKSTLIFQDTAVSLYEITFDNLFRNTSNNEISAFNKIKDSLSLNNGFWVKVPTSFIYYNSFENEQFSEHFRGTGSFAGSKKGKNTYAEFSPNTFSQNTEYVASIWFYNNNKDALNLWFRFIVEEFDEAKNEWYETVVFPEQSEVINGNWSLVEVKFYIKDTKNKLYIVSKGKDDSKATLIADDLLIRESSSDVYKIIQQEKDSIKELFKNNHQIIAN